MTGLIAKQMVYEARILFESIASNDAPAFTNREWSVLLTNAQNKVVYEIYKLGFDKDEESRIIISSLLKPYTTSNFTDGEFQNSFKVALPKDCMYVTMDRCYLKNDVPVKLVSMPQEAYFTNIDNPFQKPSKKKFWKIIDNDSRLIITDGSTPVQYKGQYIKRPHPIIVSDLPVGKGIESINGQEVVAQSDCKLHPNIHRRIVEVAARLAYAATLDPNGYQIQNAESQKI